MSGPKSNIIHDGEGTAYRTDPSPSHIKTFWFDLGNVILYFDLKHSFQKLRPFTPLTLRAMSVYFRNHPTLARDCDTGKIQSQGLYKLLKRDFMIQGLRFGHFKRIWQEIFAPNRPVISLLRKLKDSGYRMILISNTNKLHYDYIQGAYPVIRLFDHHVLSYRIRARKPSKEIFSRALGLSEAAPQEILYIDDHRELIREARRLIGVHGHTFRGIRELKTHLRKLKIRLE